MSDNRREVFSEQVSAGSRTYFFDVKEMDDGSKYLSIREVAERQGRSFDSRMIVADRDLPEFHDAVSKVLRFLGPGDRGPGERGTLDEIRQQFRHAYDSWRPEEDEALRMELEEGKGADELARMLERQPKEIRSRLAKLGLLRDSRPLSGEASPPGQVDDEPPY